MTALAQSPHAKAALGCVVLVAALAVAFAVKDPLLIDEKTQIDRLTLHTAKSIRDDLAADMRARLLAQVRLARLAKLNDAEELSSYSLHAQLFLEHYPADYALIAIDRAGRTLSVTSGQGSAGDAIAAELDFAAVLQPGQAAHDARVSRTFSLRNGARAAAVLVPIVNETRQDGFLIGVFDVSATLEAMVADHRELGYSIAVFEAGEEIHRAFGAARELDDEWGRDVDLPLPGVQWTVRAWPEPRTLEGLRSSAPELAFLTGAMLGFLLMVTAHFGLRERIRSDVLRDWQAVLEARVAERTLELHRANLTLLAEIVERKRAEDSLRHLSTRLLTVQDEERRHIARDLHDSTTQLLGALSMNLANAEGRAATHPDSKLVPLLRESAGILERVMIEIRTLSYLLHPPMLEELGLDFVLPWYAEGFTKRSGIQVTVDLQPGLGRLPHDVELTLFRIAQEGLTNVHRHSGSPTARIALHRSAAPATVTLEIEDRGRGMPEVQTDQAAAVSLGVGVMGMRERVRQLGGRLEIHSADPGTRVVAVLPLT